MHASPETITIEELHELIDLIKKIYGFDFSYYSKASLKRRLLRVLQLKRLQLYDLKHLLVNDPTFFQFLLEEITVNVTEMFRDPSFYKALNSHVIPYLSSYQHSKIWCAGCRVQLAMVLRYAADG